MGIIALILGIIGGLCTVMGVITAVGVLPPLGAELTAVYWLILAGVLFLATTVSLLSRSPYE